MKALINHLKKKPKHTRKRIAFVSTSIITFFIFLIWVVSFPSRIDDKKYAKVSPLNNLKANTASIYSMFKDTFSNLGINEEVRE